MGIVSNVYDVVELGHFEKPFKVRHLILSFLSTGNLAPNSSHKKQSWSNS